MGFNVLQATWGSEDLHQNSSKLLWARNMFSLQAAPLCAFFFLVQKLYGLGQRIG